MTLAAIGSVVAMHATEAGAGCIFHQDQATVCTIIGGDTDCTTTIYYDLICSGGGGTGGSGPGGGGGGGSDTNLTVPQREAIKAGMSLAVGRLLNLNSCKTMYTQLQLGQTDGISVILNTNYIDASSDPLCHQYPNAMWTNVGSATVSVCGGVPDLRNVDNAMLMLHEARHTAGQPESPGTPGAPSSADLSGFVRDRCDLP
jgi:hypothetical protein